MRPRGSAAGDSAKHPPVLTALPPLCALLCCDLCWQEGFAFYFPSTGSSSLAAPVGQDDSDGAAVDGGVQVLVYQLLRLPRRWDLSSVEPVRGLSWLVEASALAVEGGLQEAEERLTRMAKQLEPVVRLSKIAPEQT